MIGAYSTAYQYRDSNGSELHESLKKYAEHIIEKQTPSSFFKTNLSDILKGFGVAHLFIRGFNTEYCCMFTAISAFDRGYKVSFLEDGMLLRYRITTNTLKNTR